MFNELLKLLDNTEANQSNFLVASIIVDKNNKHYKGVNVENKTLNIGICAERNAIFSAISLGMKWGDLTEVHILAKNISDKKYVDNFTYPCGTCRQIINEASFNNCDIYLYSLDGEILKTTIKDLLPNSFKI